MSAGARDPNGTIRVLIVDDHVMVAEGFAAVLSRQPDIEIVGMAGTAVEGIELARRERPLVVLMDYQLPDLDGAEATRKVLEVSPDSSVLMVTGSGLSDALARAIEAGCSGFLIKGLEVSDLDNAVRAVARGELVIHATSLKAAAPLLTKKKEVVHDLTVREVEVLSRLADGATTASLASSLFISESTARNHINNVITKLGVNSRLQAVSLALKEGIVTIPVVADG